MRGEDRRTGALFSYVDLESRVRADHPLRAIRDVVNAALAAMSSDFEALYSRLGRPGIAPERLLRALLLQCFYSVRSERQLMERLEFDLLFRWFVGLGVDDPVWDASMFSQEPRPAAGGRGGAALPGGAAGPAGGAAAVVERALLGGRHAAPGLGQPEELPAQGRRATSRRGRGATASGTSRARSARTRPMPAPPTRTRGSIARATASRRSSATSGTR